MKFLILTILLLSSSLGLADQTCRKSKSKSLLQKYSSKKFQMDGPKDTQAFSWAVFSQLDLKARVRLLDDLEVLLMRPECISRQDGLIVHDLERLYGVDEQSSNPTRLHSVIMALSGDEYGIELSEIYNYNKNIDAKHSVTYIPLAKLVEQGYPSLRDQNTNTTAQNCKCSDVLPSEEGLVCIGQVVCGPSPY